MSDPAAGLYIVAKGASMLVLFIALFLVAKTLRRALARYDIDEQLTGQDNLAEAVSASGYYIGFTILFCGAYLGPSYGFWQDLVIVGGYSILGLALLNVSRFLNDFYMLPEFSVASAIRRDRNTAAGVVLGCNFVASALIVAGAIQGEGGGVISALVFYALGQLALTLFAKLQERLTPYKIQTEIRDNNVAAGLGFGGGLVALGVVLMAGVKGDFVSWSYNLSRLAVVVLGVFVYLVLVRLFFDKLVISKADLNKEIATDHNTGAGLMEFAVAVSFASVLFFMLG